VCHLHRFTSGDHRELGEPIEPLGALVGEMFERIEAMDLRSVLEVQARAVDPLDRSDR
jgi:hypothetical protein